MDVWQTFMFRTADYRTMLDLSPSAREEMYFSSPLVLERS